MENETFLVYVHTCNLNGKKYVGMTSKTLEKRSRNGNGYSNNEEFYTDIRKYGWENFTHEVLERNLSKEKAKHFEKYYISLWDTTNPEHGYNITKGGDYVEGGWHHKEETKRKQSQSMKGKFAGEKNPMYGKRFKQTEEAKHKIGLASKGNTYVKGRHLYNNGEITIMTFECPDGFTPGRLKRT